MRLIIVGGVAAGMSAATRARRLSETAEIVVLEAGPYVSFANCGLPYHLAGEIADRKKLLVQKPESLRARANLDVRVNSRVTRIDRSRRVVAVAGPEGEYELGYDDLILAPGAQAVVPDLPGIDLPQVSTLQTIDELDRIMEVAESAKQTAEAAGRRPLAVVLGAGFIGLETAEALATRGFEVAVVEAAERVLAPMPAELSRLVEAELTRHGVAVHTGQPARAIEAPASAGGEGAAVQVRLEDGALPADLVVCSVGVRPRSELAADAGLALTERGAIVVDECQRTSDPHIYAAGDATACPLAAGGTGTVLLAAPANRQGRRAADAILGAEVGVAPTPVRPAGATAIVRVFDLVAARTGASAAQLEAAGADWFAVRVTAPSHAGYYPGAQMMNLVAYFGADGTLLGAAATGGEGVDKRIDVLATALQAGMTADDLTELDLCYAPPFGAAKDAITMLGMAAQNVLTGLSPQVDPTETAAALEHDIVLDVRNQGERDRTHMPGTLFIPLPQLRERIGEVHEAVAAHPGARVFVHCRSGQRSYLAVRILRQNGIDAVNISGGELAIQRVAPELWQ
ncbi:MAG: FAD-dependent oxidoreductase [Actinomycetaceae bacterium]|nr:FAD-dependent oxidoreductase [Actinomycetaceae bacterium]MDU0970748.1 FAD-dependent oxidoreductase [Actinomycetaceae bacterium]